jgi:hypothetical protein
MTTQKDIEDFNGLCRDMKVLYPHGLPAYIKRYIDIRYTDLFGGAPADQLGEREVPVAKITYNVDFTHDREGNAMVRVTVSDGDDILETEDFYSVDNANDWLRGNYPGAEKE